jgi:hypothetical protein
MAIRWPWSKPPEMNQQEAFDLNEESFTINKSNKSTLNFVDKKSFKNFVVKAVGFITSHSQRREWFHRPEYNLQEIRDAAEADSYVKISL